MADKRKKRNIKVSKPKTKPPKAKTNIKNKTDKTNKSTTESRMEIITGSRKRRKIIRLSFYSFVLVLAIALIVTNFLTPTGLIETLQNGYATSGKEKLPVNIYAQNCTDFIGNKNAVCVLNETYFELYNNNGKLITAISHGLSNPEIENSEARFLLFDRDRYSVKILNYSAELYTQTFDNVIISASIARNGTFAVVTDAQNYHNTVHVFNKNNKKIFEWNSAEHYVTDVAVAPNGKSIAVALINAKGGSFVSSVYIFKLDNSLPSYKYDFNGLVTSLKSINKNYFFANGVECAYTLSWMGGSETALVDGSSIRTFDNNYYGNSCIAYGLENNEQSNTVAVINNKGILSASFNFNAKIDDISISKKHIVILSSNNLHIFDLSGNQITIKTTDTKQKFCVVTNDRKILSVNSSELLETKF